MAATAPARALRTVKKDFIVPIEFGSRHGHQIFVYNNLRTNQVIYSLDKSMRNKDALKQLAFVGKKTVPARLRKDMWSPLCVVSFPNTYQGLAAYHALREFRVLHETQYPLSIVTQTEGKHAGQLLPKKQKGRVLMDQKANTVADLAAVLALQARPPTPREIQRARLLVRTDGRPRAKRGLGSYITTQVLEFQGRMEGVSVWWSNVNDAEFAETWPEKVQHGALAVERGQPVWPPPEGWAVTEVSAEVPEDAEALETQDGASSPQAPQTSPIYDPPQKGLREKFIEAQRRAGVFGTPEAEALDKKHRIVGSKRTRAAGTDSAAIQSPQAQTSASIEGTAPEQPGTVEAEEESATARGKSGFWKW